MSTDTTTDTAPETEHEPDVRAERRQNLKDRLLLPVGIPVASMVAVALLGISFSRMFLAGSAKGGHETEGAVEAVEHAASSAPVMWATIITIFVLFGAAGISMMKSMRSTSFGLLVAGGVVLVVVTGSILAGASDVHETAVDYGRPTAEEIAAADPANKVTIEGLGTNEFQSTSFSANSGVVNIIYVGVGGSHRLKFANDARFGWFDLGSTPGSLENQPVTLESGEYTVFCPIPGHTKMVAQLVVK